MINKNPYAPREGSIAAYDHAGERDYIFPFSAPPRVGVRIPKKEWDVGFVFAHSFWRPHGDERIQARITISP
jgi:hypothetical protein